LLSYVILFARPPWSALFPYTTLFRSEDLRMVLHEHGQAFEDVAQGFDVHRRQAPIAEQARGGLDRTDHVPGLLVGDRGDPMRDVAEQLGGVAGQRERQQR